MTTEASKTSLNDPLDIFLSVEDLINYSVETDGDKITRQLYVTAKVRDGAPRPIEAGMAANLSFSSGHKPLNTGAYVGSYFTANTSVPEALMDRLEDLWRREKLSGLVIQLRGGDATKAGSKHDFEIHSVAIRADGPGTTYRDA